MKKLILLLTFVFTSSAFADCRTLIEYNREQWESTRGDQAIRRVGIPLVLAPVFVVSPAIGTVALTIALTPMTVRKINENKWKKAARILDQAYELKNNGIIGTDLAKLTNKINKNSKLIRTEEDIAEAIIEMDEADNCEMTSRKLVKGLQIDIE